MQKTRQLDSPERTALAGARARLISAALKAQKKDILTPNLFIRVRLALKAGRSKRCSESGRQCAARQCLQLALELERRAR
ncbi:MAG TPA: hypothetical protein VEX86_12240 [Longimicrobium sp.]|nr:hypothetical protein [Longimicrobium sp.]